MEIKKLISKFITNVFEKKYSDADKNLQNIVESKMKEKIEKVSNDVKKEKKPFEKKDTKGKSKKDTNKKFEKNKFLKKVVKKGNKQG